MSISPALPDAGLPKRAMHALLLVERSCAQCSPLGVLDVPLCVVAIEHSERNVGAVVYDDKQRDGLAGKQKNLSNEWYCGEQGHLCPHLIDAIGRAPLKELSLRRRRRIHPTSSPIRLSRNTPAHIDNILPHHYLLSSIRWDPLAMIGPPSVMCPQRPTHIKANHYAHGRQAVLECRTLPTSRTRHRWIVALVGDINMETSKASVLLDLVDGLLSLPNVAPSRVILSSPNAGDECAEHTARRSVCSHQIDAIPWHVCDDWCQLAFASFLFSTGSIRFALPATIGPGLSIFICRRVATSIATADYLTSRHTDHGFVSSRSASANPAVFYAPASSSVSMKERQAAQNLYDAAEDDHFLEGHF
ncbi:predicted protein [Postia placenta Mad-698-R]|nr:predicted protein [Postia placenta Mad-698-R]